MIYPFITVFDAFAMCIERKGVDSSVKSSDTFFLHSNTIGYAVEQFGNLQFKKCLSILDRIQWCLRNFLELMAARYYPKKF